MFLSKYGVARHIYIPVVKRAVVDFGVSGDWTPATGDVKISKDGAAFANVTNLPTAIASANTGAVWDFNVTATEMQAAQIIVVVSDAATKAIEDQAFIIETYGNASAQHVLDLGTIIETQVWDATASSHITAATMGALAQIGHAGTAQSGSTSTTIKLASAASSTDSIYNNRIVSLIAGTGRGQSRVITAYTGSTRVATVGTWTVTPDTTTVYAIQ